MVWIEEARKIVSQCLPDAETETKVITPVLAEAVAKKIAVWIEQAAENQRNTNYYRGLVVRIGKAIGKEAYIQEDGGISKTVLCDKVPNIIEKMLQD